MADAPPSRLPPRLLPLIPLLQCVPSAASTFLPPIARPGGRTTMQVSSTRAGRPFGRSSRSSRSRTLPRQRAGGTKPRVPSTGEETEIEVTAGTWGTGDTEEGTAGSGAGAERGPGDCKVLSPSLYFMLDVSTFPFLRSCLVRGAWTHSPVRSSILSC